MSKTKLDSQYHDRGKCSNQAQHHAQSSPLGIAIIGASYAGLTLANILQNHSIPYVLYENKSPPFTFVTGGSPFCVPYFSTVLEILHLQKNKNSSMTTTCTLDKNTTKYPTRKEITDLLWERVRQNVLCDTHVIKIEKRIQNDDFFIRHCQHSNHRGYKRNNYRQHHVQVVSGPYQCVVGADGVLSQCRKDALPGTYLIGDARWVNDRWFDLGFRRINQGADIAMRDAIELGTIIARRWNKDKGISSLDLIPSGVYHKFCAKSIWMEKTKRRLVFFTLLFFIFFVIVYFNNLCDDGEWTHES